MGKKSFPLVVLLVFCLTIYSCDKIFGTITSLDGVDECNNSISFKNQPRDTTLTATDTLLYNVLDQDNAIFQLVAPKERNFYSITIDLEQDSAILDASIVSNDVYINDSTSVQIIAENKGTGSVTIKVTHADPMDCATKTASFDVSVAM